VISLSIGQGADGTLIYGDRFRLGITFAAGFEIVLISISKFDCQLRYETSERFVRRFSEISRL
jgi:hypothetical protein